MIAKILKVFCPTLIPVLSSIFLLAGSSHLGTFAYIVILAPQFVFIFVFFIAVTGFLKCDIGFEFLGRVMVRKTFISLVSFVFLALLANAIGFFFISGLIAYVIAVVIFCNSASIDSMILINMAKECGKYNKAQEVFAGFSAETGSPLQSSEAGMTNDSALFHANGQTVTAYADSDYNASDYDWPQSNYHTSSFSDSSLVVNPASGLPMINDATDVAGNVYGFGEPMFPSYDHDTNQFSDFDYHNNQ